MAPPGLPPDVRRRALAAAASRPFRPPLPRAAGPPLANLHDPGLDAAGNAFLNMSGNDMARFVEQVALDRAAERASAPPRAPGRARVDQPSSRTSPTASSMAARPSVALAASLAGPHGGMVHAPEAEAEPSGPQRSAPPPMAATSAATWGSTAGAGLRELHSLGGCGLVSPALQALLASRAQGEAFRPRAPSPSWRVASSASSSWQPALGSPPHRSGDPTSSAGWSPFAGIGRPLGNLAGACPSGAAQPAPFEFTGNHGNLGFAGIHGNLFGILSSAAAPPARTEAAPQRPGRDSEQLLAPRVDNLLSVAMAGDLSLATDVVRGFPTTGALSAAPTVSVWPPASAGAHDASASHQPSPLHRPSVRLRSPSGRRYRPTSMPPSSSLGPPGPSPDDSAHASPPDRQVSVRPNRSRSSSPPRQLAGAERSLRRLVATVLPASPTAWYLFPEDARPVGPNAAPAPARADPGPVPGPMGFVAHEHPHSPAGNAGVSLPAHRWPNV